MTRPGGRAAAAGLAGLALFLSGCAGFTGSARPVPAEAPAELLRRVRAHAGRLETFEGRGAFAVVSEEGAFRGGIRAAARRPDSLWIKLEGPFGVDLATARLAGGRFLLYSPWLRDAVRDSADGADLARFLPLGLDSADVVSGVFGAPVPRPGMEDSVRAVSREKGRTVLWIGPGESLRIEPDGPVVSRWERRNAQGDPVWTYEARRYKTRGGLRLPREIRFSGDGGREVIVLWEDVRTNQPLRKGWCDVRIPEARVRPAP